MTIIIVLPFSTSFLCDFQQSRQQKVKRKENGFNPQKNYTIESDLVDEGSSNTRAPHVKHKFLTDRCIVISLYKNRI